MCRRRKKVVYTIMVKTNTYNYKENKHDYLFKFNDHVGTIADMAGSRIK